MSDLNLPREPLADHDDGPSLLARSRKAVVAGALAAVGAFGPAFAVATADGIISADEVVPIVVVSLGIGVAALAATWATPNAN